MTAGAEFVRKLPSAFKATTSKVGECESEVKYNFTLEISKMNS